MKKNNLIDLIVLVFVFLFLFSFFDPRYLFSLTTTTGGDMISHFPTAVYLKDVLLPQGRIMGWEMGNYAGFPLFYHYFPLTFILMVLISYLIPIQVAFKIVTVLGTFLLPVCAYFSLKFLKYKFPIPIIGAVASLAFLFMEANSMWGGNIPSTLAGEYSYSLGLALLVLFFGSLYDGINEHKRIIPNALLVFLLGFSHGYTMILSGVIAMFFLFTRRDFLKNFAYLFKIFGLAGLLLSFWFIPFLANLPWVTSYVTRWHLSNYFRMTPLILAPFLILGLAAIFLNRKERRTWYFVYFLLACLAIYLAGPRAGVLDIRLVPFIQLFLTIFSATVLVRFCDKIKKPQLVPFIIFFTIALWVLPNVTFIKGWIKWNYEGFENKTSWTLFQNITNHLAKTKKGRVVYEHSPAHNIFGSERAFENLPYWSRRDTLEGLYMQSSISSPFVFYVQSQVSKVCSGPFPQYKYAHLNLKEALPKLKLFNVTQYIARSEQAKAQAARLPEFKLETRFGDYEIYRLTNNDGKYVVPLKYEPVLFETDSWKFDFYDWFKDNKINDVHLVFIKDPDEGDLARFDLKANDLKKLPRRLNFLPQPGIKEKIGAEEIEFTTNFIGQPHLIKVSYHPNWQVEGASRIYLVSPSFMLVYPEQKNVRLYFGKTIYNYLGEGLSLIGLSILLISGIISLVNARKT